MTMGREYHRPYFRNWYKERRDEYVTLLGSKCTECGSPDGLEFRHINLSTKKFSIGKMASFKRADVLEEVRKCELLCRPCYLRKKLDAKVAVV